MVYALLRDGLVSLQSESMLPNLVLFTFGFVHLLFSVYWHVGISLANAECVMCVVCVCESFVWCS